MKRIMFNSYQHDKIPLIGSPFHHPILPHFLVEEKEWPVGNLLLSAICRSSAAYYIQKQNFFQYRGRQDFLKNKLAATLQIRNMFNTMRYNFTAQGTDFASTYDFTREGNIVSITLSYKLNNYSQDRRGRNGNGNGGDFDDDF